MKKFPAKSIVWIVVIVLLPFGCFQAFKARIGIANTADAAPIPNLPANAQEIQFFLSGAFGPVRTFEFKTTEEDFIEWVGRESAKDPDIGEIEETEFSILRYSQTEDEFEWISVSAGLFSSWTYTDQGKYLGFDRVTSKAYFFSHTR